ncbi:MAG: 2Fe-2S iron-sulfur cluster-binding protein [Marinagarivorans sp.]|nr:2Fe-2S iron-sulfur cluster-binding protein [Marinagarivorans sp.]
MLDEYLPKVKRDILVHLFWQVRYEHEWIYQPDLAQLQQQYPQLKVHLLVSQPEQPSQSAHRININLLRAKLGNLRDYHYSLCASETLLDNLCSALETNSVARDQIHFERFAIASGGATGVWSLDVNGTAITFDGHKTLLDALEENNIPISSDCRTGSCGECQITVTQGQTRSVITPEFVAPTGRILACCCVPESHLTIRLG